MTLRNIRIGVSCGALALAACSSTTLTGNPSDGGALDGPSNNTGGSEQASGGQAGSSGGTSAGGSSSGGTSAGGSSSGGASAGGGSSGGASSGGTNSGGASSGGTSAGGASSGGAADAGNPASGGANGADAAIDAGAGNAGSGGTGGNAGSGGTDGSAASGGASSGGASDGGARLKRVFVTSETWSGDLKTVGGEATGIASADELCQTAAQALGGAKFIAWLSDSKSNVLDRIRDVGPWYRLDGVEVFANKAALTGTPLVPIDVNEFGGPTGVVLPWTGTFGQGIRDPGDLNINCEDWTDDTDLSFDGGTLGGLCGTTGVQATVGEHWTSNSFSTCSMKRNLFCFEQ